MNYENHKLENNILPFIFHKFNLKNCLDEIGNWHENIEFLYFFGGAGEVIYNNLKYEVVPGDMIIVNRDCIHAVTSEDGVEYYCLIVDLSFFKDNGINPNELNFCIHIHDNDLKHKFEQIERFFDEKDKYYVAKMRCEVLEFILYAIDNYRISEKNKISIPKNIAKAIEYIKNNYEKPLTVNDIVAQAGFSRAYFSREFKKAMGVSIVAYLNYVRCSMAKYMLGNGKISVCEAAEKCGFDNLSYFSKTYRKIMGNLPSEDIGKQFRKKLPDKQ